MSDDLCLLKYFDPPLSQIYELGQGGVTPAGFVRNRDEEAGPESLVKYLREPPLMRALGEDISIGFRAIGRLPKDPPPWQCRHTNIQVPVPLLRRLGALWWKHERER